MAECCYGEGALRGPEGDPCDGEVADAPEESCALLGGDGAEEFRAGWDREGRGEGERRADGRLEEDLVRDGRVLVPVAASLVLSRVRLVVREGGRRRTGLLRGGDLAAIMGWKLKGPPRRAAPLLRDEEGGVECSGEEERV